MKKAYLIGCVFSRVTSILSALLGFLCIDGYTYNDEPVSPILFLILASAVLYIISFVCEKGFDHEEAEEIRIKRYIRKHSNDASYPSYLSSSR